jgi:amidohydrolase
MFSERIKALAERFYPQGREIRRHLHMYPELSGEEEESAALAARTLAEAGIAYRGNVAGHGIVGLIRGGRPGKTALLRADMDALALNEEAELPYRSRRPGVMHACGHDGHTAGLLMAGMILHELRDELPGAVKLMFQPAEETVGGALPMIEAGVLEDPKVDAAFGCHLWGNVSAGKVCVKEGPLMASPDEFNITLRGKGGHGAMPHAAVDPVIMAAETVMQFQTIISRRRNPLDPAVISVCMIRGGETHNVIPSTVDMTGTIRTFSRELRDLIPLEMERILRGVTLSAGGSYSFKVEKRYPPLVNDPGVTAIVRGAAEKIAGKANLVEAAEPNMGGEDFAYLAERVPASFFFVGIAGEGGPMPHHSPHFRWDDGVLKISSACLAQCAVDFLLANEG